MGLLDGVNGGGRAISIAAEAVDGHVAVQIDHDAGYNHPIDHRDADGTPPDPSTSA